MWVWFAYVFVQGVPSIPSCPLVQPFFFGDASNDLLDCVVGYLFVWLEGHCAPCLVRLLTWWDTSFQLFVSCISIKTFVLTILFTCELKINNAAAKEKVLFTEWNHLRAEAQTALLGGSGKTHELGMTLDVGVFSDTKKESHSCLQRKTKTWDYGFKLQTGSMYDESKGVKPVCMMNLKELNQYEWWI